MANPSANHHEPTTSAQPSSSSFNSVPGTNPTNESMAPPPKNMGASVAIKHNPGISLNWTPEEQARLEELLAKHFVVMYMYKKGENIFLSVTFSNFPNDAANSIAALKKENSKRRKDDHNLTRKSKDRKERVIDSAARSSHFAARPNVPPYAPPTVTMDDDDGISMEAIGGCAGELLQRNANSLNQISVNLANCQIHENISLFCQTRDNIFKVMNELGDLPNVMKQMPPLPVMFHEELANSILPMQSPVAWCSSSRSLFMQPVHSFRI